LQADGHKDIEKKGGQVYDEKDPGDRRKGK
jgi:hypothetical protein